jgi:hypothetical protein
MEDYKFTTIGGQNEEDRRRAFPYDVGIGFRLPTDTTVSWALFIRSVQHHEVVRMRSALPDDLAGIAAGAGQSRPAERGQ